VAAAAVAVATVLLVLVAENVFLWNGEAGWSLQPAGRAFVVEIASVAPSGPAARAGLRAGDRVDLRAIPFDDRVFLISAPVAGRAFPLAIERAGKVHRVEVAPDPRPTRWDGWIGNFVLLWMASFGALIGWRRPAMPEARLLSLALSCYVVADALQLLVTPSALLDDVFAALNWGGVLGALSLAILVRFTSLFGRPSSRVRRIVDGLAYAATALLALYGIAGAVALGTDWFDPVILWFGTWAVGLICGAQIFVLVAGACAIAASRGVERQRVSWALASIGSLLAAEVVQLILTTAVPTYDMTVAMQACVNVFSVLAPIGLTYSVLSRRLLDIGFALNRAAVFSAVSVILVGTFMIVEWALGSWLASAGHVTSTAVSVALAVGLGFSIRVVHGRIDRVVDALFFHRRHEQEKALLRFAHEASFISDAGVLIVRTASEVAHHSDAAAVAIMTRDADGTYRCAHDIDLPLDDVSENDPAVLALRASMQPVDLHQRAGALRGEYAFPMSSRGLLVGILVCGPKRHGEPYAPDECEALAKVAHGVGGALDALTAGRGQLEAAILELQDEFSALRAEVRELVAEMRANRSVIERVTEDA
jgi:hypothetical protein